MAKKRAENAWLCDSMGWIAGVIVCIGLFAVFAWQSWFRTFHLFLFEPGSWLFSYTDTLIRLFPIKFWFDATLTISGLSFAGGLLLVLGGSRWQVAVARSTRGKDLQ